MAWIDITSESGENVMINIENYIIAKPEGKGSYLVCKDPKQSIKVREALAEIDFDSSWIAVKTESGTIFQINGKFYLNAKPDGRGSYLVCSVPDQSLKIHESLTQFRSKFRNVKKTSHAEAV